MKIGNDSERVKKMPSPKFHSFANAHKIIYEKFQKNEFGLSVMFVTACVSRTIKKSE